MISVYTNGFAIFLCGLFTGIYGIILGKTLEKFAVTRRTEELLSSRSIDASKHADLTAKLFLSAGTLEELDGLHMTSNLKEVAKMLEKREYRSLELKSHIFEDEAHMSVIGTAICKGISSVFSKSTTEWT